MNWAWTFVAQYPLAILRLNTPLIEPDERFSRIRLRTRIRAALPLLKKRSFAYSIPSILFNVSIASVKRLLGVN